jgi:hypothetical protein
MASILPAAAASPEVGGWGTPPDPAGITLKITGEPEAFADQGAVLLRSDR